MDSERASRHLARVRIVVYVALLAGIAYVLWRYDVASLPAEGCSPLVGLEPGERMVLDCTPGDIVEGDAVLFRGPHGDLLIGRVASPPPSAPEEVWEACRAGALWIVGERPECPGPDSLIFGPVERERVRGRVLATLPW